MANNDILSRKFMMAVVEKIPINTDYIGEQYLPLVPVSTEELTWDVIMAEQRLAGIYSIDGKIIPGANEVFKQMFTDICRIGASRVLLESDYRRLRDPGMVGVEMGLVADIRAEAQRKVARLLAACNSEVEATLEYLRVNALRGYIPWPPPGLARPANPEIGDGKFAVDFQFPSNHIIDVATDTQLESSIRYYFSDWTNADPMSVFERAQIILEEDAGVNADQIDIIMNRRVLRHIAHSDKMRDLLKYTEKGAPAMLTGAQIREYIQTQLGWNLIVYGGQYTTRAVSASDLGDVTVKRWWILPTNLVLLVPRPSPTFRLGDTATSPSKANDWRPGKFTWTKEEENPWRVELGVGINAFPRLAHPEAIIVLKVDEDPTGLSDNTG